ncbi:MAG: sigma-70 family RNA polymerase sigma factor [Vicinamibacterales bacterium]
MPDISDRGPVTRLLGDLRQGRREAVDEVLPLVYAELRAIAARYMRQERAGHTLQATVLVHDAFLKLVDQTRVNWQDRAHFFAVASQAMRRILVDHARARDAAKRGAGAERVSATDTVLLAGNPALTPEDLLTLDQALTELAALDPSQARIVELRYFGGLSIDEAAEALNISPATLKREWALARAWLHRRLAAAQ